MSTKAFQYKKKFEAKVKEKGFSVLRTRPSHKSIAGVTVRSTTARYNIIEDANREIKEREMKLAGGGSNQANDGFKALLFPWNADVIEGDILEMSNISYQYIVSKADSPFQIGSEVVYWQVQAVRKNPK
jgi:hypothetical protein